MNLVKQDKVHSRFTIQPACEGEAFVKRNAYKIRVSFFWFLMICCFHWFVLALYGLSNSINKYCYVLTKLTFSSPRLASSFRHSASQQSSAHAQLLASWNPQHMRRSSLSAHDGCQFCASCHAYVTISMVKFVRQALLSGEPG